MAATMISMEYRVVDTLNADQLEVGDLIGVADEVVEIVYIDSLQDGYVITYKNEFGEKDVIEFNDNENKQFDLYLLD